MNKQKRDTTKKRKCSKCKINFRTTYSSWCNSCARKKRVEWMKKTNYDEKTQKAEWAIKNKTSIQEERKEHYKNNREKYIANAEEWGKNNREKRSQSQMKYINNNINAKFAQRLRNRLYSALKGVNKSSTTIDLLGCTIPEFLNHMENKFTPEMNWENYGSYWEMDHIKPCDSFDLSKLEEQKKCFTFTNIQPLEKIENRKKSNKI